MADDGSDGLGRVANPLRSDADVVQRVVGGALPERFGALLELRPGLAHERGESSTCRKLRRAAERRGVRCCNQEIEELNEAVAAKRVE